MDTHQSKQLADNQAYNKTAPWTSGRKRADGHTEASNSLTINHITNSTVDIRQEKG